MWRKRISRIFPKFFCLEANRTSSRGPRLLRHARDEKRLARGDGGEGKVGEGMRDEGRDDFVPYLVFLVPRNLFGRPPLTEPLKIESDKETAKLILVLVLRELLVLLLVLLSLFLVLLVLVFVQLFSHLSFSSFSSPPPSLFLSLSDLLPLLPLVCSRLVSHSSIFLVAGRLCYGSDLITRDTLLQQISKEDR